MRSVRFFAALVAVSVVFATVAGAEPTEVGTTAAINTDATGTPPRMASRNLFIGTNVFFEERIETSKSGQAQLLFLDESALTIASNSDVVIDKFIYDPKTSKGELALSLGAGLFRFVGGRISKTSRVRIKTPTATIGIRGGIAIIRVEPGTDATRAIFMFGKEMTVTNDSGVTRRVTRPGFAVDVASKGEEPSSPRKVSGDEMAGYLNELEGRSGRTAGLTETLTDEQVAGSGCCLPVDPGDIVGGPTAANGTGNGPNPPPLPECGDDCRERPPAPPSSNTIFNSTFAGRFKTESPSTTGTGDGDPAFDIPISGASVVDGFLTEPATPLLLPTSGTPIAAPPGFTGFSFDGTGTISPTPVGPLVFGEGFISDDGAFIFYETIDSEPFRGLTFAGVPTPASAFPPSGITAYLLEPDFVLRSNVPFIRGVSDGNLTVAGPAPAFIDWGNDVFGGALIAIDGQGTGQISAASVFGGSVVNGTPTTADLEGLMRGTTRLSSDEQPHLFDSAIELSRDGDGNAFFGAESPDYFVFQSVGGATEEFEGTPTTYFPNVVAHTTTEPLGTRTTRTLNGYSGGVYQEIDSGGAQFTTSIFRNTNVDPSDIQIDTVAANGTITATFDVASSSEQQIVADFGGTGVSAFFDDESFGAIEASATSAEFEGNTVTKALLYMVDGGVLESSNFLDGVTLCQCEFLQWGFWGGDLELSSGDHVRIHLANWVAGELPALLDMPTTGTATYSGHAIGTVNNNGDIYQAIGGFSQTYDFATGSGPFSVTNFDGVTYSGSVNAISEQENLFTGTATVASPVRTLDLNGAFFSGGGDPVASVGGGFDITGSSYEASGIFAADK